MTVCRRFLIAWIRQSDDSGLLSHVARLLDSPLVRRLAGNVGSKGLPSPAGGMSILVVAVRARCGDREHSESDSGFRACLGGSKPLGIPWTVTK